VPLFSASCSTIGILPALIGIGGMNDVGAGSASIFMVASVKEVERDCLSSKVDYHVFQRQLARPTPPAILRFNAEMIDEIR
jgi:hypothetical protein